MTHWMCTTCGYYLQGSGPPERCPSCSQVCAFNDVTCYRPECGGDTNIDPLLVGHTLKMLKGTPEPAVKPKYAPPSEGFPSIAILRGLSEEQRQQFRNLGRIAYYEPQTVIFNEGVEAWKFYSVEEGQVGVESRLAEGMRFPISIVSVGQAFGWSALVRPYLYTATAVAMSQTRVIAFEREALLSQMRENPELGFAVMQNIATIVSSRLRNLAQELVGVLLQDR